MKKIVLSLLCFLIPTLVLASEGSLTFSPPPGDLSVIFLGNIFGIVDGVLHGTGSQIMGAMFGVFNAAVLAIGGMIIMYTLVVSTMNTAQEGQMLGQKFSSIWVPLRATLGLALLIPKASGYCVMQIFVMWLVLQGVGAADKVWDAALSYLNRGGVIVQSQMSPSVSASADKGHVTSAAGITLAGQVCMLGIQTVLETQRQNYLNDKQNDSGSCSGNPSPTMQKFCNTAVPDFLSSVNAVTFQSQNKGNKTFELPMPNFPDTSEYNVLNGICGHLNWNKLSLANDVQSKIPTITNNEMETAQMSRAIAIQQLYMDLSSLARIMINNDPLLNPQGQNDDPNNKPDYPNATQQYGVAYTIENTRCDTNSGDKCQSWGPTDATKSAPLFSGTEFQGAIADYNGIMLPTLNLMNQYKDSKNAAKARQFIQEATSQGWILAGSYFFDLSRLNSSTASTSNKTDTETGLEKSKVDLTAALSAFSTRGCTDTHSELCVWMDKKSAKISQVIDLINGANVAETPLSLPEAPMLPNQPTTYTPEQGALSSTVFGFINNSMLVHLPGQPGLKPPAFSMKFNINIDVDKFHLKSQHFSCGSILPWPYDFCLGRQLGNLFYNDIIKHIFNFYLNMLAQVINGVIMSFLSVPLLGIAAIFKMGVSIIEQPLVNPVVALANMGVNYINFANEVWVMLLTISISTMILPLGMGMFILPLILLAMPLLIAWLGIMLSIGFITAYYIPFLPYMIFTFGAIAWLMVVIEAMVAAPIVALGVTHPEGHEAFGKGEQAIMILFNVFLRPSMMIIGYIAAIALSYVSVWIINAGFSHAMEFIQGSSSGSTWHYSVTNKSAQQQASDYHITQGYSGWAGVYGFFFSILVYTSMYLIVVQKAFTLITYLPDRVLRWISGGAEEKIGQETAQWAEEGKGQVKEGGSATSKASQQIDSQVSGYAQKYARKAMKGGGGDADVQSKGNSTPKPPEE